jgi:hypothetical protein
MTSRCGGVTNEPRRRQCASGSTSQRAAPSALRTAWSESVAAAPCICAHPALSRVMCRPTACGDREGPMAAELGVGNVFEARRHGWHVGWGRSLSLRFPCICSQRIDGGLHPSQTHETQCGSCRQERVDEEQRAVGRIRHSAIRIGGWPNRWWSAVERASTAAASGSNSASSRATCRRWG